MKIIAFRIWMIAVIANTIFGTAWLTHFFIDESEIPMYIFFGFVFGTIVSLPFFLILLVIINRSISKSDTGKKIFMKTLISGSILASMAILIFLYCFGGLGNEKASLFFMRSFFCGDCHI